MWEGGDAWIIGGGPSIPKLFGVPEQVINDVLNGRQPVSAYSPYMESIHSKHTIGINTAFLLGDWVDFVFFGDSKFFLKFRPQLEKFRGISVSCSQVALKYNWVKYLDKDKKKRKGISTNPEQVSWNGNSGCAAISMAYNMGAKRIFLLGFDMKLDDKNSQHWHSLYKKTLTTKNPVGRKNLPFSRHLTAFSFIAQDMKRLGIEIYNVCPESAIKELPKVNLNEVL